MDYTTKAKKSKRSAVKNITVSYRRSHNPTMKVQQFLITTKKGHQTVSFALACRTDLDIGVKQFDKLEFVSYLTALTVYVAPQLFNTSTDANPASTRASSSCFTVSGVS